jgi:antibiotic biosynthesis monooxygenase (ABM) superfamily enzyme
LPLHLIKSNYFAAETDRMSKNIKHKRAFLIWMAIYPLITILFLVLGDYLMPYPVAVRTLVLTAIAVPTVVYVILPFYEKLFAKWLNKEE